MTVWAFRGMNNINAMKAFMVLGDLMTKEGDELSDEAVKYKDNPTDIEDQILEELDNFRIFHEFYTNFLNNYHLRPMSSFLRP